MAYRAYPSVSFSSLSRVAPLETESVHFLPLPRSPSLQIVPIFREARNRKLHNMRLPTRLIPPGCLWCVNDRGNRGVQKDSRGNNRGDKPRSRGRKIARYTKGRGNKQLRDPKIGAEKIRKIIVQIARLSVLQRLMGEAGPLA